MSTIDDNTQTEAPADEAAQVPIRVEHVDKHFARIVALDDVTFDIQENEVLAMVGDNGAGKSTLMNVLCGVHKPTNGQLCTSTATRSSSTILRTPVNTGSRPSTRTWR